MNITIDARRWFQKTYGNTYHSVKVYADNSLLEASGKMYGYGDSYLQTAHELLAKHGIFSWAIDKTLVEGQFLNDKPSGSWHERTSENHAAAWEAFLRDLREHRERYHVTCNDVSRERDL